MDREGQAAFAIVFASSACESGTAPPFLPGAQSRKRWGAAAEQGRSLLPHAPRRIPVRWLVQARRQDTTARLRLKNPGRDHHTLDFAGAFVNFGDAGVAIVALDGIFAAVA